MVNIQLKVIFLTLHFLKLRWLISSSHTKKPKPPTVMRSIRVIRTTGSLLKGIRLCPGAMEPKMSKPALQKAETAWNTPQTAA